MMLRLDEPARLGLKLVEPSRKPTFCYFFRGKPSRARLEFFRASSRLGSARFQPYTQGTMARHEGKFVMADVQQRLLCFEYLPKGSLHEYITDSSRGLQWRYRYNIIKGICQGLHYLHQKNIVHLDLKPANILVDDNLVAKITDFGLSRCFDEMQSRVQTLKICGTLGYLAPEFGNGEITYQFDIYSLGVIILEILTGKKGYQDIDKVVESWSNMLEKSQREVQQEQVRVCAEIGIECTNFNPAKRPDTQHIINRLNEYIETDVITSQQAEDALNELHQDTPKAPGETSSEENFTAITVAGTSPYDTFWRNIAHLDMFDETVHSLNSDIKRCIEYCSIFPIGSKLRRHKLVCLWKAQGFVKVSCATEDMEEVAEGYFQELVACSFLQPVGSGSDIFFTIHEALHDLLDKVAVDCFRIENTRIHKGEGWEGDVSRDIKHLLIQNYDVELIEKFLGLENLQTLIVYVVGEDTRVDEKVIQSICKRLLKLRVLAVGFSEEHHPVTQGNGFLFPQSVGHLKYLRYLAFRTGLSCKITLPGTLNKIQHIQLLDFGHGKISQFIFAELVNLRHIFGSAGLTVHYVGRLSSLQTLPGINVSNEQGCELKQLRDLNELRGKLHIGGLENVESKGQALEANLAAKRLTELQLMWGLGDDTRFSPEVEADVLEGLCPPPGLQVLTLKKFVGSRYPDWMVGKHSGGPKYLQKLYISQCRLPVPASEFAEAFPHLRVLWLSGGSWDALPDNMEHLTSLNELHISVCKNIRSLPTLPQSLDKFTLRMCNDEFQKSCQTVGHSNWQKIEHVPDKSFS